MCVCEREREREKEAGGGKGVGALTGNVVRKRKTVLLYAHSPQTPKHIGDGWSHHTYTNEPGALGNRTL
jgi:hypothetical protein